MLETRCKIRNSFCLSERFILIPFAILYIILISLDIEDFKSVDFVKHSFSHLAHFH